jgi:3'(2'), 5'-bisphosphate nucleotidase
MLNFQMLKTELDTAIDLAQKASAYILEYYKGTIIREEKIGVDNYSEPVTVADREASRIIVQGLNLAFPDDAILSEEEPDNITTRLQAERVWIIDPIDGTAGFVKKDGDFAVQIGLAIHGASTLGVVMLPFHQKLYYAVKGGGSWLINGSSEPVNITVSDISSLPEMTLAVSKNHPSSKMRSVIDGLGFTRIESRGSVGLKIGLIGERICDIYIHLSPRTKMWDICGPQIILEEAGGRITDLYGVGYNYDRADLRNFGGIVASNGVIHDDIIEKMEPLLASIGRINFSAKDCP